MGSHRSKALRTFAALAVVGLLAAPHGARSAKPVPAPPINGSGDDQFLLQAETSPQVVLIMDNSKSMNQIEWHPAFDHNAASYGCSDFDNATQYTYNGDTTETHCGKTRKIYGPTSGTLWDGRYLNWYFSAAADPYVNDIATAKANVEGCTQAGGAKFFADKYRRTRFDASKQVLLDLLCVAEPKNVRFALATFRSPADAAGVDPNGACITADLGRANPNHAAELEAAIKNQNLNSTTVEATPLAESLFQTYTYWMPRTSANTPVGVDGTTHFPTYSYDKKCGWSPPGFDDGWLHKCEKAFVVVVTDGLPSYDNFDLDGPSDTNHGFADYSKLIGDYNPDSETEVTAGDITEASYYLDDIAKYMNEHDARPDLADTQVVQTYTVGLATDTKTDAFLSKAATLGGGLFFHVQDGDQLTNALVATLNDIIEKSASFTAAAVPSARTVDGGDLYQSFFIPRGSSAAWEGHVRAWRVSASGDILDKNGVCALDDPTPGKCSSGPFKPSAQYVWDAADVMPSATVRNLFTSKVVSGTPTLVAFDTSLTKDDLYVDDFANDTLTPPDITPNSPLYPLKGSQAQTAEGLADEIVQYARGCYFGTGVTDASLTQTPQACLQRPSRLGDVFHSNPLVVRQPRAPWQEPSYSAFKTAYGGRSRYIYTGTNAGFLESLEAGAWLPSATPPKYGLGTGVERFGFMPWQARAQIKNFPIDDPSKRTNYVDGSPQAADVWVYPTATTDTKAVDGSEWRTMLVTGMRLGGREYFGLDVTNPDGAVGPGGVTLPYPGYDDPSVTGGAYGWEFPPEGDPDNWLPKLGFSWGQAIITRVKISVNNDGKAHERWVAIVTAGYDASGDPDPDTVTGLTSSYDTNGTAGRGVFMLDVKTGQVLARKLFDTTATDAQPSLRYATPMTPAVFDLNGDGFADLVIVGDLGGRVFKWVVNAVGGDPVNGTASGDDVNQPNWPFKLFFQAPSVSIGGKTYYKNFYTSPTAGMVKGKLWIAFGSGEREFLQYTGNASGDENNRFYVVSDPDPLELGQNLATVTEANLKDATGSQGGVTLTATQRGFYIKGGDGEKFVTNPLIFAGKVIAASFTPTPNVDPCAARGISTGYVFDLLTGMGFFADASGNPTRKIDLGVGLPTDPRVSVGVGGKNNRVYIEKSGADLVSYGEQDIPAGAKLLYWREMP